MQMPEMRLCGAQARWGLGKAWYEEEALLKGVRKGEKKEDLPHHLAREHTSL